MKITRYSEKEISDLWDILKEHPCLDETVPSKKIYSGITEINFLKFVFLIRKDYKEKIYENHEIITEANMYTNISKALKLIKDAKQIEHHKSCISNTTNNPPTICIHYIAPNWEHHAVALPGLEYKKIIELYENHP